MYSLGANSQSIVVNAERPVQNMRDRYIHNNSESKDFKGWRIQFYSTTDRRNMESTLRRLKSKYPGTTFTWVYDTPYYRLRAGAFRYRNDLLPLQHELKKEFPGAFPIEDQIESKELTESF